MQESIKVENLRKNFKGFTLNNISFDVPKGCVVGFIGENGAGKSTTIKSILGLVNPDAGQIEIFGKRLEALDREDKNRIGSVLGETCLPENLNLKDIDGIMKHIFTKWDSDKYFYYAKKFSLPLDKKVREFSRGMRQKVSLAVALSHEAEILILDEPTSGLDPVARDEMIDLLYDFMQDETHSILISSHILSDLEKLCDYILFIHDGKIIFEEEKDRLTEKYGVLKCTLERLKELDAAAVVGYHKGDFGVSALVRLDRIPKTFDTEKAGIEDIMLYFVRGEKL